LKVKSNKCQRCELEEVQKNRISALARERAKLEDSVAVSLTTQRKANINVRLMHLRVYPGAMQIWAEAFACKTRPQLDAAGSVESARLAELFRSCSMLMTISSH
jgi:hypothetical protein